MDGGAVRVADWVAFSSYEPALRRYFQKRVRREAVDDLLQDVFISLYGRGSTAAIEDHARYLFTIARHALHRKAAHDRRWQSIEECEQWEPVEEISPERQLEAREQLARVVTALSKLPARTRDMFLMHRFEQMTYRRIADSFGVSVSAVEKHMMAALSALSQEVGRR